MKNIILIVILTISVGIYTQNDTEVTKENENDTCILYLNYVEKAFKADVKKGTVKMYVMGGIVSVIKGVDRDFEKQYGIQYHDFGCLIPANLEHYKNYNRLAFDYLKEKFGNGWKGTVNSHSIGWKT